MRQSDRAQSERVVALEALIKQNLETTTRLKSALDVIERAVNKQSDAILPPVTRTAAKVDALTDQFGGLRDAVAETNAMDALLLKGVSNAEGACGVEFENGSNCAVGSDPANHFLPGRAIQCIDRAIRPHTHLTRLYERRLAGGAPVARGRAVSCPGNNLDVAAGRYS